MAFYRRNVLFCALPALILALICLIPFLNKAFLIDDPYFVMIAEQILRNPLQPLAFDLCWFEGICAPASQLAPSASLIGYFLAPAALLGSPEWAVHGLQLIALCAGILGTVSLGLRLGLGRFGAIAAGLLFAASPVMFTITNSAMPDTLAVALGVIGIDRLLAWKEDGRPVQAIISAVALGLAPFARMHLVVVLFVGVLLIRDKGDVWNWRSWLDIPRRRWLPLATAPLILAAAFYLTMVPGAIVGPYSTLVDASYARQNLRLYFIYLTLATPFALSWMILQFRGIRHKALWLTPLALIVLWKLIIQPSPPLWAPIAVGIGLTALAHCTLAALFKRSQVQLALVTWMLAPMPVLIYSNFPPKFLLAGAPAMAILVAGALELYPRRVAIACLAVLTSVCVGYSCLLLQADAQFADISRAAASELIAPRVAEGKRVWFSGQWGSYWYSAKAGAILITTAGPIPEVGDLLVLGHRDTGWTALKRFPKRTLIEERVFGAPGGRTMSPRDEAGLHLVTYGPYLWAWGTGEIDRYQVWRID